MSDILTGLGRRARAKRIAHGWTIRDVAERSGVSPRFLVQLEAGRGNISVRRLADVARALETTAAGLLTEGEAGAGPVVALLGLRGAGKTTLGSELAAQRGVAFVELDREIEREAGTSMNEILLLHGQAGYRRYERRALLRIADEHAEGVVMTTGGSIVSERETFDLLQSHFYCVWVKASPEEHMSRVVAQGDMRPFNAGDGAEMPRGAMTGALEDIRRILASREALYARADAVVDTAARTVKQSLKDLERAVPAPQAISLETR
jgi:XRE family transcriptional regulator, aerobic/anaerobic benzoate catabolism transcriptional regulator